MIFFKNELGGGKDFLWRQMQKSQHLGICLAGKQLTEKQPQVNISDETSGT